VGYVDTAGDFEEVDADGPLDVNGALLTAVVKWLPGPVSSLGSGAVKGSRRYLVAWKCFSFRKQDSLNNDGVDVDHGPGNSRFAYLLRLSHAHLRENSPIACLQTENPFSVKCGLMFIVSRNVICAWRRANIYLHETQVRERNGM